MLQHGGVHVGGDEARPNRVDGNAAGAELLGQRQRHRVDRALGHAVRGDVGNGDSRDRGGEVDDPPSVPQPRQRVMNEIEGSLYIHRKNVVERGFRRSADGAVQRHAGVVHEDVEAVAAGARRQLDVQYAVQRLDPARCAQIRFDRERGAAGGLNIANRPERPFPVPTVMSGDQGAVPRQTKRDRPPDAPARPRHQCDASFRFAHGSISLTGFAVHPCCTMNRYSRCCSPIRGRPGGVRSRAASDAPSNAPPWRRARDRKTFCLRD